MSDGRCELAARRTLLSHGPRVVESLQRVGARHSRQVDVVLDDDDVAGTQLRSQ